MSESFVVSEGVSIWTVRDGAGYPILLCNGGPGCCDYLEPVADMLCDMAQVIRFEPRGCGRSQPAPPYRIETCLRDLEAIRSYYQIDRWIIGGHSWGADLALFYALEYTSQVAGLICIAGGRIHNDRQWHSEYERGKKRPGERLPEFAYPVNREVNSQLNRCWKEYIQNPALLRAIAELAIPALFIYGDQDIRPRWPIEQVATLMPNARFELIEGAEHVIWLSRSDEMKTRLRNFVGEIEPGAMA